MLQQRRNMTMQKRKQLNVSMILGNPIEIVSDILTCSFAVERKMEDYAKKMVQEAIGRKPQKKPVPKAT